MSNSSCLSFPDDPHKCDVILTVRKVSGSISFVGCLFMIFIIWLFKRYVVFAQRLILYLSISALMRSIAYMMGSDSSDGPVCTFKGWWLLFFSWMALLCVSCLTFNLFMNVIKKAVTEQYEWLYIGVCVVVPLFVSCLPFLDDKYGPAGAWCWIVDDIGWRMGIWYAPLFTIILVMMITYGYIIYHLTRKSSTWEGTYDPNTETQHRLLKEDIKPLRIYPFIYLAVSVFPLINRIQNAVSPDSHVFALVLIASIFVPLHGALNAIVFGMDRDTLHKLRPHEIKIALQAKMAPRSIVQEYPQNFPDTQSLDL